MESGDLCPGCEREEVILVDPADDATRIEAEKLIDLIEKHDTVEVSLAG